MARGFDFETEYFEEYSPWPNSWFAMVDMKPYAYWKHPCLWVFLNDSAPDEYEILPEETWPTPFVDDVEVPFECIDLEAYPSLLPCGYFDVDTTMKDGSPGTFELPPEILRDGADCVYAVLVGSGSSRGGNLMKKDVKTWYDSLRGAGVPDDHIKKYDNGANEDTIREAVKNFCKNPPMTACDNLVILLGGHGEDKPVPHITTRDDGWHDWFVVDAHELTWILANCRDVCRVFVFMSCCHSGAFIPYLEALHNSIIVTACAGSEIACYRKDRQGTNWASRYGAEIPGKSAKEAHDSCKDAVTAEAKDKWGENQNPEYGKSPTVQHEDKPIAYCCIPPSEAESTRWGTIKALFR